MTTGPTKRRSARSVGAIARFAAVILVWGPAAGVAGAGAMPEVTRVRVPEGRVSAYLPPGTAIRTLSPAEFDALVAAAEAGVRRQNALFTSPPRVDHSAHRDGATLVGRSVVPLPATGDEPAVVVCDPWSPAVGSSAEMEAYARVDAGGRLVLVQPAHRPARTVAIPWHVVALPDSAGRAFDLRLPEVAVATCTLDLAAGVRPTSNAASVLLRRGPGPASAEGLSRWEFVGAAGHFPIFCDVPAGGVPPAGRLWVGGTTRVDLSAPATNWVADWTVDRPDGAATTCLIALDPGLELVDVAGPDVAGFRPGAPGAADRVEVNLRGSAANRSRTSAVTLRGLARVPLVGPWLVPSARPVDAQWMGGRTEVRLDPGRVAATVEPRSGRRVAPRPDEATSSSILCFESDQRAGPSAEVRLAGVATDASVEIRGVLRVGAFAPVAEVAATWQVDRGRLFDPTLDLPSGWAVQRVVVGPDRAPARWHVEAIPGGQRVRIEAPPIAAEATGRAVAVRLVATRVEAGVPGAADRIVAPRIRPTTGPVRVLDERWEAAVEPGWSIEPAEASGLAWLDPARPDSASLEGSAGADPAGSTPAPGPALAWRWVADDAAATFTRRADRDRPRLDERVEADLVGGRLRLAWSWTIAEAGRPGSLAFGIDLPPTSEPRWRLIGPGGGRPIRPSPLDPARREASGLPPVALDAELPLDQFPRGSISVRGEVEVPWAGAGSIPLFRFPDVVEARRSVVVRVEDAARFRVERAAGLDAVGLDGHAKSTPAGLEVEPAPIRAIVGEGRPGLRVAGAWLGSGGRDRLDVATTLTPTPGPPGAVVTEATLVSRLTPGIDARHRLSLRVAPGAGRSIDLALPAGTLLDRVRRDGQPVAALGERGQLRVDLAGLAEPARATTTITLDYRTKAAPAGTERFLPAAFLPTTPAPCLSFTWQVNVPERFEVRTESPDLVGTDAASLAEAELAAGAGPAEPSALVPEVAAAADLDATLSKLAPGETTLGDWLIRLDAGRWPLLVDRIALAGIGWGPRSRIELADPRPDRPARAAEAFRSLRLTVEPVGGAFLVSTEAEGQADPGRSELAAEGRAAVGRALMAAALAGSDRSDRYQTPARWRGEPTPRSWLASETPDRGLVAPGWRPHRFAAATWPAPTAAVVIRDGRTTWRSAGVAGVGLGAVVVLLGRSRSRAGRRAALLGLVIGSAATSWADPASDPDPAGPIVAILPYVDLKDVAGPPERVVLRQVDHDRLTRLARAGEPPGGATRLIGATHRVGTPAGRTVAVTSRYALEVAGPAAGSWSLPVAASLDLTATLDGRPAPLAISPDGQTATVRSLPAGASVVEVRRLVPFAPVGDPAAGAGSADVGVARAAFARVEVARTGGGGRIDLEGAVGRVEVGPEGLAGDLGPVDRFSVRWGDVPAADRAGPAEVSAQVGWDAGPAGDRVEARLTVAGVRPLRSIRLDLEPGLDVVGSSIPGLVGATRARGSDGRDGWVAAVDPPLAPGSQFELTLWRSISAADRRRSAPRWGLDDARISGVIALRVPADWSGRWLPGPAEADRIAGDLGRGQESNPPDGAVGVGSERWVEGRRLLAEVGPAAPDRVARTEVVVEVEPGRFGFAVDSTLSTRRGASWDAEARFDGPVRVGRVEAEGLATWTQPAPDRLVLTFDGSTPPRERRIRLLGTVAVDLPVAPEPETPREVAVPWPTWVDAATEPGRLVVAGGRDLVLRSGGRPIVPEGNPTSAGSSRARSSFRIRGDDGPLRLGWVEPSPRLDVTVRSDLRVDPSRVTWTARVVTAARGGPIRTLAWRLPTAWTEGATLTAPAGGPQPRIVVEARDDATSWTIEADRPVWGSWELNLRATRAIGPGDRFDYPQVAPFAEVGRGSISRYDLTLTNLAGRPIALEAAQGLVALTALRARSPLSEVPGGIVSRAFRVAGESWSLGVRSGAVLSGELARAANRPERGDDLGRPGRLDRVDFQAAVDSTGRVEGRADCLVAPGGEFLPVLLAGTARLDGVTVEGRPVPVATLHAGPGGPARWLIPLGDRNPRRVMLHWTGGPTAPDGLAEGKPRLVSLPRFDQAVPASVRLATTGAGDVMLEGGAWTRPAPLAASLARFERWGERAGELARQVGNEPSPADLAAVVAPLTAMALEFRAVERATRDLGPPLQPPLAAWRAIRARAEEAVTAAGLGEALDRAGNQPGEDEAPDVHRIRQLGRVIDFEGTTSGDPTRPASVLIPD